MIPLTILILIGVWVGLTQIGGAVLLRRREPDTDNPPDQHGMPYELVTFPSRDGVSLSGWWIPAPTKARGTIILCSGQAGNKDGDTELAIPLHQAGFAVLMFDYRAHGQSEGEEMTFGMFEKEDVLGAVDYAISQQGAGQVGLYGLSMGGAVALITAALSDQIGAVVSDGGFARLKNTLARWGRKRGIPYLIGWQFMAWALFAAALRTRGRIDQVDPILWAPHVRCPVLFIQGEKDPFVTTAEVEAMAGMVKGEAEVWLVPQAGHRESFQAAPKAYRGRVVAWFEQHLDPQKN